MSGPTFVLDGSNLAWLGPGDGAALAPIDAIVEALRTEWAGAQVIVIADASLRHRLSSADKAEHQRRARAGALVEAPADEDADAYILAAARRLGGCVVTRDLYRDRRDARAGLPMIRPALIGGAVILGEPKMFVGSDGDRSVAVAPETLGEHHAPAPLPGAAPSSGRRAVVTGSRARAIEQSVDAVAPAADPEGASTDSDAPVEAASSGPTPAVAAPRAAPRPRRRKAAAGPVIHPRASSERPPDALPERAASIFDGPDEDAVDPEREPAQPDEVAAEAEPSEADHDGSDAAPEIEATDPDASDADPPAAPDAKPKRPARRPARRANAAKKTPRARRSSARGARSRSSGDGRGKARTTTPPTARTAFGAALLLGLAALAGGLGWWALAEDPPPPVRGPLFVRACNAWQIVDGVETIALHAPPDSCITGVAHHPPSRHVVTVLDREGDEVRPASTHGALRVIAFEDGTPVLDHPVTRGIDRTEDGLEITVAGRLVGLAPDGQRALLQVRKWTGDARSDTVVLWQVDEGEALGTRPAVGAAWLDGTQAMVTANPCPRGCGRLLAVPTDRFTPASSNKRPRPARTGHTWAGPIAVAPDGRVAIARAFDEAGRTTVLIHDASPTRGTTSGRPTAATTGPRSIAFAARHTGHISQLTWRDDGLWMAAQNALYHIDPDAPAPRWSLVVARVDTAGVRW